MCVLELAVHPCVATDVMPSCLCTQPRALKIFQPCVFLKLLLFKCLLKYLLTDPIALLLKRGGERGGFLLLRASFFALIPEGPMAYPHSMYCFGKLGGACPVAL